VGRRARGARAAAAPRLITRPRGASKTTDLAGIGIATLLEQLPPASRSYAAAADRDQAALLVDAMAGFVSRTPGLPLKVDAWKATATRTGATLEVLGLGRGLILDCRGGRGLPHASMPFCAPAFGNGLVIAYRVRPHRPRARERECRHARWPTQLLPDAGRPRLSGA
jgi:hypothetical protein